MQWNWGMAGFYEAELESPDGTIKLSCFNWLSENKKWTWLVRWPGGQTASVEADAYAACKAMCEMAGEMYEPFGDGFRKKPGL